MSVLRSKIKSLLHYIKYGNEPLSSDMFYEGYKILKHIALKYSSDKTYTEDIIAESYYRIYKYIDKYSDRKDGFNWLCKIVKNVALDFNNGFDFLVPYEELKGVADCAFDAEVETKGIVGEQIARLSPYEQNLIYLRFWDDLTYAQMAKKLNGKKSTIYKQVNTIIKKLNGNIENYK